MIPEQRIAHNLAEVKDRMRRAAERAGRDPSGVRLVAVTKTVGIEEVRALCGLGIRDFGENRALEAAEKLQALAGLDISWHMIGHLQRNKVRRVVGAYRLIHSVDSLRLAREIDGQAASQGLTAAVLLQLNVAGEEAKSGLAPGEARAVIAEALSLQRVRIMGLMTMAPIVGDPQETRPVFRGLRELRDALAEETGAALAELSMGMTQDFEIAIEEGATLVRIGSALFE